MASWILPTRVKKNSDYWYELDRALETLKTIFWGQSKPITNVSIGEIVYLYESSPVKAICWKCKILAVKVPHAGIKEIDDSEFEHGYSPSDFYIKITALAKYDGDSREKLSYAKLCENGLTTKMQGPLRANPQLLEYINSVEFGNI